MNRESERMEKYLLTVGSDGLKTTIDKWSKQRPGDLYCHEVAFYFDDEAAARVWAQQQGITPTETC